MLAIENAIQTATNKFEGEKVSAIYKTSQGSVYFTSESNSTLRYKSVHKGHEVTDKGWKDLSYNTVYISEEDALYIAGPLQGNAFVYIEGIGQEVKMYLGLRHFKTKEFVSTVDEISFSKRPAIGLCPFELFELEQSKHGHYTPSKKVHVGNQITELITF